MTFKEKVFPFATELVSGYLPGLNLKDKSVLTVGSSLDQAFNALLLGAKNVTVYDLNPNIFEFYKIKRDLILMTPKDELYEKLLEDKTIPYAKEEIFGKKAVANMNCYLTTKQAYESLRQELRNDKVRLVVGDIFEMNKTIPSEKYDRIIFSNALQYLKEESDSKFINEQFNEWSNHLNENGIIQLLYLYSYGQVQLDQNARKVINALCTKSLNLEEFYDSSLKKMDAIFTYTKRR